MQINEHSDEGDEREGDERELEKWMRGKEGCVVVHGHTKVLSV